MHKEEAMMQDSHLLSALQSLKTIIPGKLVENEKYYTEQKHKNQQHFRSFISEEASGNILHPSVFPDALMEGYLQNALGKISHGRA
ncbi:hypothetical protein [Pseudomonas putida]|uniref:Uncharacterized protein n=1 Tax=Pseudomonas putida TaxID=303 RepID=A0A6I7EJT7_PSEPU|nr:hypothetical protein [Pseudomonas putida]QHW08388.1 hypothetical protein C2H86_28490 [Pseudomonas putida]